MFSQEVKALTLFTGMLLMFALAFSAQARYYESKLDEVKIFCIGKTNKLSFCEKILQNHVE